MRENYVLFGTHMYITCDIFMIEEKEIILYENLLFIDDVVMPLRIPFDTEDKKMSVVLLIVIK